MVWRDGSSRYSSVVALALAVVALLVPRLAAAQRIVRNVQTSQISRTAVSLSSGQEYEIRTANLGAGVDPYMHLLNWANGEVAQNDDIVPGSDLNSLVQYAPSTSGTFYVVVRSYSASAAGFGKVQIRSRPVSGSWGAWSDLMSSAHFGGAIGNIEWHQRNYRTVMVQPAAGGTSDTVLYVARLDYPTWTTKIIGYDDDGGVGRLSSWNLPEGAEAMFFMVGTYHYEGVGKLTDVLANDSDADSDGDGLGVGLETALGSCDSTVTFPYCSSVFTTKDSDHDGLWDFDEVFGYLASGDGRDSAAHLPAWGADPKRKDVFIQ